MKKVLLLLCFVGSIAADVSGLSYVHNPGRPKMLHLAFHLGCIKDIEEVIQELGCFDLTSWYIAGMEPRSHFDGVSTGNEIWTLTHDRAEAVWQRHKEFFEQFDVIFTSDVAALSRIFLQHGWKKPLIVWICNRFNSCDPPTAHGKFPDQAYYKMFQDAVYQPNVRIISYTDLEWLYAENQGLSIGRTTIRPIGAIGNGYTKDGTSLIPDDVDAQETLFVYPRLNDEQYTFVQGVCEGLAIPYYKGVYNGPNELAKYKAVLYFPYQWSNLALYENFARGIIHFVPSRDFISALTQKNYPVRNCTTKLFDFCEWYKQEYKDVIVYFDSWQDLKTKFQHLDYDAMQSKIRAFGKRHRRQVLVQWKEVFDQMCSYLNEM